MEHKLSGLERNIRPIQFECYICFTKQE